MSLEDAMNNEKKLKAAGNSAEASELEKKAAELAKLQGIIADKDKQVASP